MPFNPDKYLADNQSDSFDPDTYLGMDKDGDTEFNPNQYLSANAKQEEKKKSSTSDISLSGFADYIVDLAKSEDQKGRETMNEVDRMLAEEYPDAGLEKLQTESQPGDILTLGDAIGPTTARVGVPLLAIGLIAGTKGLAAPLVMSYLGSAGILGDRLARRIEGAPEATLMENTKTGLMTGLMAPMKIPAGVARSFTGGILEGAAIGSGMNEKGEVASKEGAFGAILDAGFRGLENKFLKTRLGKGRIASKTSKLDFQTADELHFQSGINETVDTRGVYTQIDDLVNQRKRNKDFLRSNVEEIESSIKRNQVAGAESIILENVTTAKELPLDIKFGKGVGAVKQREKIALAIASSPSAQAEIIAEESLKQTAKLSPQASRIISQYGGIDPRVMAPVARAAIGSVAGVAQGDTPEEKLGYALTYAGTGAVASPTLARKMGVALATKTNTGRNWLPEVTLRPYMEALRISTRNRDKLLLDSKIAINRITKALNTFKNPVQREEANVMLYEYLHGKTHITNLPKVLVEPAKTARVAIDDLSEALIDSGMLTGKTRESIVDHLGEYVRRSYKVFTEKGWKPEQKVVDRWVKAQVDEAISNPKNTLTRQLLEEKYSKAALDMVNRDAAEQFFASGKGVSAEIFKQKKHLDQLTRDLLGEIRDPLALLKDTVPRMAKNVSNFDMQKSIVEIGENLGQMTRNPSSDPNKWVRLAAEDTPYNGFAGVYTSPEIKQAWESITKNQTHGVLQSIATISSVAKASKTLGSPKGYTSNAWNALFDTVAQGHGMQLLNPKNWKNAANDAGFILGFRTPSGNLKKNEAYTFYKNMVREGLVNKSVSGQDFLYALDHGIHVGGAIGKMGRLTIDKLGKLYMTPETAGKVFSVAGEMKTLKAAQLGKTDSELFKIAAAKVRSTSADFDYLPRIIKQFSTYGGLNPFVAYTFDRFRVVYNTYSIGMKEIASGNPALVKAGAKRIASMTTVLGAVSYYAANKHLSKEQNEAMRRRMPPWDANGFNRISDISKNGEFSYVNLNYIVGQSVAIEAAAAAMRGDSPAESAKLAAKTLFDQLSGVPILFDPVVAAIQGKTETGNPIRSPSDSLVSQALDTGTYLINESFVPLAKNEMDKFMDARDDNQAIKDILMSNFAGIRIRRQRLDESFRYSGASLMRDLSVDQKLYRNAKRDGKSPEDQQAAYYKFENRRMKTHEALSQIIKDMPILNIPLEEGIKILRNAKVPSRMIASAIDGVYMPTSPDEAKSPSDYLDEWSSDGVVDRSAIKKKIDVISRADKPLALRIYAELNSRSRDEKLGITERDKLISGFSATDGSRAEYLAKVFIKIRDEEGQARASAYINDLKDKRLVPPAVYEMVKGLVSRASSTQRR